jgi:hypothetical protein
MINKGVSPQSVWDALFVGSAEMLMRQPAIVALHTLTTSNAIRYAFDATASDETRKWLLLQNAAFLPLFRQAMFDRGDVADARIDELAPATAEAGGDELIAQALADVGRDNAAAASKALAYLEKGEPAQRLIDAARVNVFLKGNDSHDYKFSSAVLEDYYHVSPAWRNRFLAGSVFKLCGSSQEDNDLVARTRAALA